MGVYSILFLRPEQRTDAEEAQAPDCFRDLHLDQVVEALTAGRSEYRLQGFFHTPLRDVESIAYRQEVFRDLDNADLEAAVRTFADRMRTVRGQLAQGGKLRYRLQQEHWFLEGRDYTLRRLRPDRRGWRRWLPGFDRAAAYTVVVLDRDESGLRALSDLRDQGLNLAANALAQSADHILGFFTTLREALGFYLGCLTLWERLVTKGEPVCFPEPLPPGRHRFSCRGLYDVTLSLRLERRVVGNDVDADDVALVVITGANPGGKSTFLRSVGLAHLMLQCGMFVGAGTFRASLCEGLFTHYHREEDPTLQRGKWEEELDRMRTIVERLPPRSLVLFNEAFAATNEREGAEIVDGIVRALVGAGVRVF